MKKIILSLIIFITPSLYPAAEAKAPEEQITFEFTPEEIAYARSLNDQLIITIPTLELRVQIISDQWPLRNALPYVRLPDTLEVRDHIFPKTPHLSGVNNETIEIGKDTITVTTPRGEVQILRKKFSNDIIDRSVYRDRLVFTSAIADPPYGVVFVPTVWERRSLTSQEEQALQQAILRAIQGPEDDERVGRSFGCSGGSCNIQ